MERLADSSFNGLDNTDSVDLWPFFTSPILVKRSWTSPEPLPDHISDNIMAALKIWGPTTSSYHVARDKNVEVSDQAVLFRCLTYNIPQWLANTNLLGRYAITSARYTVALFRISRYLLRLSKGWLAAVTSACYDNLPESPILSASMRLAQTTFSICMDHIPRSIELYFFVLFIYSVFAVHTTRSTTDPQAIINRAKTYLLSVSTQIFLPNNYCNILLTLIMSPVLV